MRPRASAGRLALQLLTAAAQVSFLQDANILPVIGVCHSCGDSIISAYKEKGNEKYWKCDTC